MRLLVTLVHHRSKARGHDCGEETHKGEQTAERRGWCVIGISLAGSPSALMRWPSPRGRLTRLALLHQPNHPSQTFTRVAVHPPGT